MLLNRTAVPKATSSQLRCDPSIINYVSHNLLTSDRSGYLFEENVDQTIDDVASEHIPLAESSRRIPDSNEDTDQTLMPEEEDEQHGPLTSTLIDRWYPITKGYSAMFRQDLSVRRNELVQVLRSTHPHWIWVRNEENEEGFVPTDCLISS